MQNDTKYFQGDFPPVRTAIVACIYLGDTGTELAAVVSVFTCVYTENTSFSLSDGASTLIG